MPKRFADSLAETRDDFLKLVSSSRVTYYEVYDGEPNSEIELLLAERPGDELLLRFDMRLHTSRGRDRFCALSDFDKKVFGFSPSISEMPLPYCGAYLLGYGNVDFAWTLEEVKKLVVRTQEERRVVEAINAGAFP